MNKLLRITSLVLIAIIATSNTSKAQISLNKGDEFTVTSNIKQNIVQNMFGQEILTNQTLTTVDKYSVTEIKEGFFTFEITGIKRYAFINSSNGNIEMDSEQEGDSHLSMKAIAGKTYSITFNKYGKVQSIKGLDEVKNQIIEELKGTILEADAASIAQGFNEETLVSSFESQFNIYSDSGFPWDRNRDLVINNMPILLEENFTQDGAGLIKSTGKLFLDAEMEVQGNPMTGQLDGDQNGTFEIAENGLPARSVLKQNLTGKLVVQGMDIPMDLKTEIEIIIE